MTLSNTKEDALIAAALIGIGGVVTAIVSRKILAYKPPEVWENEGNKKGGKLASINAPIAGPRKQAELPKGTNALQLHSLATPNGVKCTALLEELNLRYGVEYDAFCVDIMAEEQFTSGFVAANPNSKIPVLLHYNNGLNEEPIRVFETAAIMMYLCENFDEENVFFPPVGDPKRAECLSWLMFTQGSAPFLGGGFGHFYAYAPVKIEYAINRYTMETKRLFDVLDRHLSEDHGCGWPYLCGDRFTIADMACWPWYGAMALGRLYAGSEKFLQVHEYKHVMKWAKLIDGRKGVRRGSRVNKVWGKPEEQVRERHSCKDFKPLMEAEEKNENDE